MFRNNENTKSLYSYTLYCVLLVCMILSNPNTMVSASSIVHVSEQQQQRMLVDNVGNEGARISLYVFFFGTIGCIVLSLCRLYSGAEVEEPVVNIALKKDDSMDNDEPTHLGGGAEKSVELPETSIV